VCAYELKDESFYPPNCKQDYQQSSSSYGGNNSTFTQGRLEVGVHHANCGPLKGFDEPVKAAWNSFAPISFSSPGISQQDTTGRMVQHGQQTMMQQPVAPILHQENATNFVSQAHHAWEDSISSHMDIESHLNNSGRLHVPRMGSNLLPQNHENGSFDGATFQPAARVWGNSAFNQPTWLLLSTEINKSLWAQAVSRPLCSMNGAKTRF
jgi:hypothetical protein